MQITISGHHVQVTQAIRSAVEDKFLKLQTQFADAGEIAVILTVERQQQKVEANTHYLGINLTAHASAQNLYQAISQCAKKLKSTLTHRHGSANANLHSKPSLNEELSNHTDTALSD